MYTHFARNHTSKLYFCLLFTISNFLFSVSLVLFSPFTEIINKRFSERRSEDSEAHTSNGKLLLLWSTPFFLCSIWTRISCILHSGAKREGTPHSLAASTNSFPENKIALVVYWRAVRKCFSWICL